MIVAAGLLAGCETLLSKDMQDGMLVAGQLRVADPFTGGRERGGEADTAEPLVFHSSWAAPADALVASVPPQGRRRPGFRRRSACEHGLIV
jgi:hypothetical protein